jgi:CRISPR/Cas system-associated protein Cas5 (RAMP superfamily)
MEMKDKVNHPSHYTWLKEKCGVEVIDITRHLDFDKGNAVKYLLRSGYKAEEGYSSIQKEIEDLEKAIWYIKDKIRMLNGVPKI